MIASAAEIEALACNVWGDVNEPMSSRRKGELRFGKHGSKALRTDTSMWFDHEAGTGGGYSALYKLAYGRYPDPNGHDPAGALEFRVPLGMTRDLGQPVAWWDYHDAKGSTVARVVRFEPVGQSKQYRQCRPTPDGWQWTVKDVDIPLYRLPGLLAAPDAVVYLTEGEKCADALRVWGLIATTNAGGARKFRAHHAKALVGRHVVILPDNDEAGRGHAEQVRQALVLVGARVRTVELPGLPDKGDVINWMAAGGTAEALAELVACSDGKAPAPKSPTILVTAGLRHEQADLGLAAMRSADVQFYQRDRTLVRIVAVQAKASDGSAVNTPGILPVSLPALARALGQSARWEKPTRAGTVPVDPPREVVEQIGSMIGEWRFPPLTGVIGTQTMRADGSLLLAEGYDPTTGLYLLCPPRMAAIADRPTQRDAEAALSLLNELLFDFPFVDNASRSVGISMLMTPVLRGALAPAVPMHVVTAPTPGTGKSYLLDLASVIAVGERCAAMSVAPKEEETEKRLIGAALNGHPIIALDNCNSILRGDFLCQVTERPTLRVRQLGGSALVVISNVFTIFANGNNVTVSADLTRRTIQCVLDSNMEDPTQRTFSGNPLGTVLADRGRYIAAILTIARAYLAAGKPNLPHRLPSYERWSELVCGALVWLGRDNPMNTMAATRADDPELQDFAAVLEAWPTELTAYSAAELIAAAQECNSTDPRRPKWLEALKPIARNRRGEMDPVTLGNWLRNHRDKMHGRQKLVRTGHCDASAVVSGGGLSVWVVGDVGLFYAGYARED